MPTGHKNKSKTDLIITNEIVQAQKNMFLGEVAGICSLIFLSDAHVITSGDDAKQQIELACYTERGYGQMLLYAFHPAAYPETSVYLREAGWRYLTTWPSAHPGLQGPMELWGVHTGQEQH